MRRVFLNFVETDFCQICFQVMGTRNLQLAKYVEASIILFVSLYCSAGARQSSLEIQLTVMCWFLGLRQGLSVLTLPSCYCLFWETCSCVILSWYGFFCCLFSVFIFSNIVKRTRCGRKIVS